MSIISENIRPEVTKYLGDMKEPVTIDFYPHSSSPATDPMKQLLSELKDMSPQILLLEHDGPAAPVTPESADDIEGPVTTFSVKGHSTGIRYLGFPGGQEFGAFLEDMVDLSTEQASSLSQSTQDWLKSLDTPLHLEVFVTPT